MSPLTIHMHPLAPKPEQVRGYKFFWGKKGWECMQCDFTMKDAEIRHLKVLADRSCVAANEGILEFARLVSRHGVFGQ